MTTVPGVGPQHARAAAGTDPRGILVFEYLPADMQRLEDSRADADRRAFKPRGSERPATLTERILLAHLNYSPLPAELTTVVRFKTTGVRNRRWPQLEGMTP
jgi:hypothetical protein